MTPEILYGVGALVLLLVIGYGVFRDRTRDRRKDELRDAATREEYQHPERFERKTQKSFEDAAKR